MLSSRAGGNTRQRLLSQKNRAERLDRPEWGDGSHQPLVTAVRFGGVDAPTFRDPSKLTSTRDVDVPPRTQADDCLGDLSDLGDLVGPSTVDQSSIAALLHESAQAAYEGAERLLDATVRIAASFRRCELDAAARDFSALLAALRTLTHVTALVVTAGGTTVSRNRLDALVNRLCAILDAIAEHQTERRWYAIADLLDGDVASALDQWSTILAALYREIGKDAGLEATTAWSPSAVETSSAVLVRVAS